MFWAGCNGGVCVCSAAPTGAAYQAGQAGYAVAAPATAAATYGTQRAGYDQAYQAAAASQGTYAAVGTAAAPAYEYGYGELLLIKQSQFSKPPCVCLICLIKHSVKEATTRQPQQQNLRHTQQHTRKEPQDSRKRKQP